jgi:hypothetical protein
LLSASADTFATLSGQITAPHGRDTIPLDVTPTSFTIPKGGAILGFAVSGSAATPFGPGQMQMTMAGKGHAQDRLLLQRHSAAGGAADVMLARMGAGSFALQMTAGKQALGSFQVNAYLAGDVNGDRQVDSSDVASIRSLLGVKQGQPGYNLAADVNRDGQINAADLRLARLNLGAATTVHPPRATLHLDPASDPDGNGVVTRSDVLVDGQTTPGSTVVLFQPTPAGVATQITRADAQGSFRFAITAPTGVTPLTAIVIDPFGQLAVGSLQVTHGDVVIAWDQTMIAAIRADRDTLGLSTRTLAMVSAAMFDAVNDIERQYSVYKIDVQAPPGASPEAAASMAAYQTLVNLLPKQKPMFDATLAESLATIPQGPALNQGLAVGLQVANGILALRTNDGSNKQVPYTPGNQPGQWRPTPPDFSAAWGPEWGQVTPFAIPSAAQFMPPPPPPLNSPEYLAAFNEVKSLGAANSTTRTPEQTLISKFWGYDSSPVGPPPLLYNQIVQQVSLEQHNSLTQDARLFALANIAMTDAGIVAWQAKFTYNFWRPVTAIQQVDPSWQPLGAPGDGFRANFTPAFPAYISGHATFGGALFTVMADFYGTDNMQFTIRSDETAGVTRTFNSFSAAAEENGESRIYLGIHWNFDKTNGIATGDSVGNYVFQHALQPV